MSGGRIKQGQDAKIWLKNIIKDEKEKKKERQKRKNEKGPMTKEEIKIMNENNNLGIVQQTGEGIEMIYKFLPETFTKTTMAKDLRRASACALGIATSAISFPAPSHLASAVNTCISWVGNMVLRRLAKLDLAANNKLKRQRFAGAPQASFLNGESCCCCCCCCCVLCFLKII